MTVLLAFLFQLAAHRHNAHRPAQRPSVTVVVAPVGNVPNVEPPTRLDLTGLDGPTCADYGGTFDPSTSVCRDVDY